MTGHLQFLRDAGETRRFHTVPVLRSQTVAEHSWGVAQLAWYLYGRDEPGLTMPFLMACLCHDMAECKVGDLPAPAKRNMAMDIPDFRERWGSMEEALLSQFELDWQKHLTDEEKRRLKLCDSMEGALYCVRERQMGNQTIAQCYMNFISYITSLMNDPGDVPLEPRDKTITELEWEVRADIQIMWSKANGL